MKFSIQCFCFLGLFLLAACDNDGLMSPETTPTQPTTMEIREAICDSASGVVKTDLYAQIYNLLDEDWIFQVADSALLEKRNSLYLLDYICQDVPDTLRQHGLELLITYVDKSQEVGDTSLYLVGELLTAKLIDDFPFDDPRNGVDMATVHVKETDGDDLFVYAGPVICKEELVGRNLYTQSGLVFNAEFGWQQFLSNLPEEATSTRMIDFESRTLLFQHVSHGGCGWLYKRSFTQLGLHLYEYRIAADVYGGCQAMQRTQHWVTVPKLSTEDSVVFVFEEIFRRAE